MEKHSLSEKSVDLRQEDLFIEYVKTRTVSLDTEDFFLSKITVL